jgi:tRNA (guanine-N7-)-methyltransferase
MIAAAPVIRRRSVYADKLLEFSGFAFSDGAEFRHRGAWHEFFRSRIGASSDGRIILEIGCNDAALLTRVAERHPATAFMGIDWKCRALHTAAGRIADAGLRNVAFLHGRAQDVRQFFANDELDEVWLFHPDPCDKPNELRNRLFAEPFLLDVHCVMRRGTALILKTDHPDYFASSLTATSSVASKFDLAASSSDFWKDAAARNLAAEKCFAGESSFFESRYLKKRRPIHYLEITKR